MAVPVCQQSQTRGLCSKHGGSKPCSTEGCPHTKAHVASARLVQQPRRSRHANAKQTIATPMHRRKAAVAKSMGCHTASALVTAARPRYRGWLRVRQARCQRDLHRYLCARGMRSQERSVFSTFHRLARQQAAAAHVVEFECDASHAKLHTLDSTHHTLHAATYTRHILHAARCILHHTTPHHAIHMYIHCTQHTAHYITPHTCG